MQRLRSSRSMSLIAAGISCVGLTFAAAAQQSASPLSPTPSLPAAPMSSSDPSPTSISLARDVIVQSGISRSFETIVPQFLDQIGTNLTQTRPDLIRDLNLVMEQIKPDFDKQTQDLITRMARLYAQRLNEAQLRDTANFFKSPSGVAYVASQPVVMNDMFSQMQSFQQRLSGEMMTRVRTEMKKRGHDL